MTIESHQISSSQANSWREKKSSATQRIPVFQLNQLLKQVHEDSYIYFYYFENIIENYPESIIIASRELAGLEPGDAVASPSHVEFLGHTDIKGGLEAHQLTASEANQLRKHNLTVQKISYLNMRLLLQNVPSLGCVYFFYSETLEENTSYPQSIIIGFTELETPTEELQQAVPLNPDAVQFLDYTNIHPPEVRISK